jgi:putative ABC transport system substrate-binding protein
MRRRDFIALAFGAVSWPPIAHSQQPTKVYHIFWVSTLSQPDPFLDGFREGLRERGYIEERTLFLTCITLQVIPQFCGRWSPI